MTDEQIGTGQPEAFTVYLYVLWRQPLVCVVYIGNTFKASVAVAAAMANGGPFHILAAPQWRMREQLERMREVNAWLADTYPKATLTVMTATEADAAMAAADGVSPVWTSHAALVDERIFYIQPDIPKTYDAVYTANTCRWKRHELAQGVNNLALVTYSIEEAGHSYPDLVRGYRSLSYINYSDREGPKVLDAAGVRGVVGRARCGLILSAVEGPNNATMEYLLCGLPVVTTPSEGGREEMYDPRHVTIVEPTPEAVKAAVAAYQASAPDPLEIRNSALSKARSHRARLLDWLSGVVGRDTASLADGNMWLPQFRNKLSTFWWVQQRPDGSFNAWPE